MLLHNELDHAGPRKRGDRDAAGAAARAGCDGVLRPNFLGICAPRTGTNWLRHTLRLRSHVRLVDETLWFYDLCLPYHQFSRYFLEGHCNGDLSPMYCLLGQRDIVRLHELVPDCKLVVLLRDPVSRAWSHLKHMERHRESVFAEGEGDFFKAAHCAYAIIHGDYLGTLARWLSIFPRSSLLVRFHEDIRHRPAELLRDVLDHVGAATEPVPANADLRKRYNHDLTERTCPPSLEMFLQQIYRARTEELLTRFSLAPPPEWERTLGSNAKCDLDYWTYTDRDIADVKMQILRKWLP